MSEKFGTIYLPISKRKYRRISYNYLAPLVDAKIIMPDKYYPAKEFLIFIGCFNLAGGNK